MYYFKKNESFIKKKWKARSDIRFDCVSHEDLNPFESKLWFEKVVQEFSKIWHIWRSH